MPSVKKRSLAKQLPAGNAAAGKEPAEILMLEDSATDAELVLRALKRAGIANPLVVLSSGEQALDYLHGTGAYKKHGPSQPLIILLDLKLFGMQGLDFLREVKIDERTWEIPIITLSFTQSPYAIMMSLQRGVAGHLIKPLALPALLKITRKLKLKLARISPEASLKGTASSAG